MPTYVQRAKSIVDAAVNGVATAQQKTRIADAFLKHRPDLLATVAADPENPTGAEKAEVFVRAFRQWGRSVLRTHAEKGVRDANRDNEVAAGDTAEADL